MSDHVYCTKEPVGALWEPSERNMHVCEDQGIEDTSSRNPDFLELSANRVGNTAI